MRPVWPRSEADGGPARRSRVSSTFELHRPSTCKNQHFFYARVFVQETKGVQLLAATPSHTRLFSQADSREPAAAITRLQTQSLAPGTHVNFRLRLRVCLLHSVSTLLGIPAFCAAHQRNGCSSAACVRSKRQTRREQ